MMAVALVIAGAGLAVAIVALLVGLHAYDVAVHQRLQPAMSIENAQELLTTGGVSSQRPAFARRPRSARQLTTRPQNIH